MLITTQRDAQTSTKITKTKDGHPGRIRQSSAALLPRKRNVPKVMLVSIVTPELRSFTIRTSTEQSFVSLNWQTTATMGSFAHLPTMKMKLLSI